MAGAHRDFRYGRNSRHRPGGVSELLPVASPMTWTAVPITSAGRFSPLGPSRKKMGSLVGHSAYRPLYRTLLPFLLLFLLPVLLLLLLPLGIS
jgi:hypothetical protein